MMRKNGETQAPNQEIEALDEGPIEPCEHMTNQINSLADGTLHGVIKHFTRFHAWHCGKCSPALRRLIALRTRVITLRQLPRDAERNLLPVARYSALKKAMDALESGEESSNG
ncbi:MAG: hypothetical protein H7308_09330 [Chthonomonadaceae bacterium]|nr:hypothetical protein [Chthonomonadaceae bacterium]